MKGLAGLKRGLGYFTSRARTPIPTISDAGAADARTWQQRASQALGDRALSQELIRTSEEIGGAASAVVTALARMQRDQEAHVGLARDILASLGAEMPAEPDFAAPEGTALERAVHLILRSLCVEMSVKCDATSKARSEATGSEQAALDVLTRDQIAHADLGFLLWPIVRHTWEQERDDDPDELARKVVRDALSEVSHGVRGRLERRFKGAGLEV